MKTLILAVLTLTLALSAKAQLVENQIYLAGGKNFIAMKAPGSTNLTLVEMVATPASPAAAAVSYPTTAPAAAPAPAPVPQATVAAPAPAAPATTHILGNIYSVGGKTFKCVAVQTTQHEKAKSAGTWSTVRTYAGNTAVGALVGGFGTSKNKTQNTLVGAGGQLATTANTDARISEKIEANNNTETYSVTTVIAEGPSTPVNLNQPYNGGFVQLVPCSSAGVIKKNKDGSVKF